MSATATILRKWRLDASSTVPPFEQIRLRLLDLATAGTLPVGTKLPSVRALAQELEVAANTVARAYRELEQAGVVSTAGRSGTQIAAGGDELTNQVAAAAESFAAVVRELGLPPAKAVALVTAALERDAPAP